MRGLLPGAEPSPVAPVDLVGQRAQLLRHRDLEALAVQPPHARRQRFELACGVPAGNLEGW